MATQHWKELDRLFHSALQCEPDERSALLDQECAGDAGLRREVEVLLAAHEEAGSFIERAALEVEARAVAEDQDQWSMGQTISHYRIVSQLGVGGMGEVYLVEDTALGRKVALKLLPAEFSCDLDRVRRFQQEAQAASALNHPNIVTIHEIAHIDDRYLIATEFIDGETLRERIRGVRSRTTTEAEGDKSGTGLPLREVLNIGIQIADALSAAHEAGIVHRDIKPENIMVRRRDGYIKVLDFGLAKLSEPAALAGGPNVDTEAVTRAQLKTSAGLVMGTVTYMSPEQTRGEKVDHRTDIWSLGVVLYELVAGHAPFERPTPSEIIAAILERDPAPLTECVGEIPSELQRIISKALTKDRGQRYQTVKDLLVDLIDLRHELEVHLDVERSLPPASLIGTTSERPTNKTSAEYIINQVSRHKRAAVVTLAGLALALLATLFWYFKPTRTGPILTDKDTILLADFENKTGDEVFDGALKQGLAFQLAQSPFLSIFPDRGVRDTLKLMNRQPDEHVTAEVAREICERQGLKAFITGSIALLGSQHVLTLEAVSGQSGEVLTREQVEADSKEQVLKALSEVATKLREKLGESLASIEKFDKPLEVTTPSLEALKAFSLGNELRDKGAHLEAVPFFERAIELDPNFASAYVLLAMTYHNTGQFGMKAELAAKAYALRDRVTERERLRITDRYYAYVTHEEDKHVETLQVIKRTYPRDPNGPFWLSDVYFAIGQFEKAVEEANEGIRRSPSFGLAYINLAQALVPLNRFDEAREVAEGLLHRQVDDSDIHSYLYQIAFVYGDSGGMRKQLDWARGRADEYVAFDWQADTAAFAGHWQKAQEFSQSAIDLAARGSAKDPAAKYAAKLASISAAFGGCAQALQSAAQAFALNQSEWPQTFALIGLALCGGSTRALQTVEEYSRRFPNDTWFNGVWLPTVRAAVELQRGNAARAIELLEPAVRYEGASKFWSKYLRAQAYLKLNRPQDATAEFQKILDHRGEAPLSALYPLAHLGLARAAALMNDTATSRREYETFFALWKNADPDIPILQRAKQQYGELK